VCLFFLKKKNLSQLRLNFEDVLLEFLFVIRLEHLVKLCTYKMKNKKPRVNIK
jgi:hypothetical protein